MGREDRAVNQVSDDDDGDDGQDRRLQPTSRSLVGPHLDTSRESSHTADTAGLWVVEARHQALVAADGSGRADGSRHQRRFGPCKRPPRMDLVRPELRVYSRHPKKRNNLYKRMQKFLGTCACIPVDEIRTVLMPIRKPTPISKPPPGARLPSASALAKLRSATRVCVCASTMARMSSGCGRTASWETPRRWSRIRRLGS